ncbi:unannotated protein [freshwater metagenome]|uniref:Unannotated protein n=1 Tax=freshwater metagenome TaxID=449393 RepID=A0A6J6FU23_9ZZZZ
MEIKILEEEISIEDKNVAPKNAPIPPGIARRTNTFLSIFSACQWETPETKVVPISAACTAAEATAAEAPNVSNKVELVKPKPIPSAPSINWATDPAIAK